jgi:lipoyl(octanoyl) transferase
MRQFTDERHADSPDEIWVVEHDPVFTLGLNGKREHVLEPGDIPVVQSDRGGQVTYHGPGQIVVYVLVELKRRHLTIKTLVRLLEQAVINTLAQWRIAGDRKDNAPGVYVNGAKIAALGLRVRKGCSYHGLSLNVAMDLSPFNRINPCGYAGLESVQIADLNTTADVATVEERLTQELITLLDQKPV